MEASSRIFVKGLPTSMSVDDFRRHFSKQSPITDARIIPHRRIGYVGFRTPEDAVRAVKYHNRSFIRMSKIGVELARSIHEQQRNPKASKGGANTTKKATKSGNMEHGNDEGDSFDATTPNTKKRRLSVSQNKGEDKLQEFLEVMQPPSKFRDWSYQDFSAGRQKIVASVEPEVQTTLAADEKPGERYELVFSKQKGLDKKDSAPKEDASEKFMQPTTNAAAEFQTLESSGPGKRTKQLGLDVAPETSDDDWLRSRMSRLLGLVGNDEDCVGELQLQRQETLNESKDDGEVVISDSRVDAARDEQVENGEIPEKLEQGFLDAEQTDAGTGRLFLRNLTYTSTEEDIRNYFESRGFKGVEEVHLPLDLRFGTSNKGFAYVQFADHRIALEALRELDQKPFQGRLLHILCANPKPPEVLDEFAISKLSHKQQQRIRRKAEASSLTFNWNSMYMSSNAVISSISDRLGVPKSELLDPTSSDAAVKQAHAETHIIQETKSYFASNGVDLDSFKKSVRGTTAILVKNFPYGTKIDELRTLFDTHGPLKRLLMPPSGTIAIVEFEQGDHARSAFGSLSYSRFKDSVLFLEKAPRDLFKISNRDDQADARSKPKVQQAKPSAIEFFGDDQSGVACTSTLYVRNLSFNTTDERFNEAFKSLDGFLSTRIKTKPDPNKNGATLSMGYGFIEFRSREQAQAALAAMDGYKLDGHELLVRASRKAIDVAEERRSDDRAKKVAERKTKIIIKNLPFEATKKDVRMLFGAYGQLRSVRVPKKFDSSTRGFAFADFVTAREADNAMGALRDTHLLGRRLILQFAAEEVVDPEAAIQQMQQKVGKQADKVALQKLTGTGRKKFNVVNEADGLDQLVEE